MCTGDTCEIFAHVSDCCGNVLLIGVESSQLAKLQACEAEWVKTLPSCGCPAGPPSVEQPNVTVADQDAADVSCANFTSSSGVCLTSPK